MKRKDLKPGDIFKYNNDSSRISRSGLYWVKDVGVDCPPGAVPSYAKESDYIHSAWQDDVTLIGSTSTPTSVTETPPAPESAIDPAHYKNLTPEPIDVTEGWELNPNLASVVWYIGRAGKKTPDARTDLLKARRFLSREIARLEGRRAWE